jgi:hypothetical protein
MAFAFASLTFMFIGRKLGWAVSKGILIQRRSWCPSLQWLFGKCSWELG